MDIFLVFLILSVLVRVGWWRYDRAEESRKRAARMAEDRETLSRGMGRYHYGN